MNPQEQESEVLGGHLLVECLVAQGVERAWGVPGESYLAALDGFHAHRDRIDFITCRQEGGAAFMAEAEGKLTGRPGVLFVTRGPGATNATVGVHTAFQDSTPLVVFIGDVASGTRDREAFQEVDFRAFLGPSTGGLAKRVERVDDASRIPEYVARAFATALGGRPGPAVVVLPEDVLLQRTPARPLARVTAPAFQPDAAGPDALLTLLRAARKPLLIAGGPGWTPEAARALEQFASAWQLPVANAFRCQDSFDNHHELYAGDVGIAINPQLAQRVREADLLLLVGARLSEMGTSGYTLITPRPAGQKLVHVYPDPTELGRVARPDLALCATVPQAAALLQALPAPDAPPWADWAQAAHQNYLDNLQPDPLPGPVDMPAIVATLQRLLPADTVVSNGAGNFSTWLHRYWRYRGKSAGQATQLAPRSGAMGYGVPAGIAAAIVTGRTVLTFTGDGDFLMTGQELATAVQQGARTLIVLLNNGIYGTIRMHQERHFPGRATGSTLHNPDFAALARAYGYAGVRVARTEQFEPALRAALQREQGTLIEVLLDPEVLTTRRTLSQIAGAPAKSRT